MGMLSALAGDPQQPSDDHALVEEVVAAILGERTRNFRGHQPSAPDANGSATKRGLRLHRRVIATPV